MPPQIPVSLFFCILSQASIICLVAMKFMKKKKGKRGLFLKMEKFYGKLITYFLNLSIMY